jgi:hypothetical protein
MGNRASPSICLILSLAAAWPARATVFESSYLRFQLPPGWTCKQENTEFLCEPPHGRGDQIDTVMILTAKVSGPQDTLAAYQLHLGQNPPATGRGSVFSPPRVVSIRNALWVDATLFGSELPNYFTRYLATSRDGIAVLFTFSAHRSSYESLVGAAIQAVYTLELKPIPGVGR